jgi:quinol-cytochrome oxidoreductase complex cytochrome b subunit
MKWLRFSLHIFFFLLFAGVIGTGIAIYFMDWEPDPALAFSSVEKLMSVAQDSWIRRYTHSRASELLIFASTIYFGVFAIQKSKYKTTVIGAFAVILLMIELTIGFYLPWGKLGGYWVYLHVTLIPLIATIMALMFLWLIERKD